MDQLWGIALRAQSADISRAAIQYINSYYINGGFGENVLMFLGERPRPEGPPGSPCWGGLMQLPVLL